MINEGARILEEGYALRAADIDTIYLTGYGFPAIAAAPCGTPIPSACSTFPRASTSISDCTDKLWEPAPLLDRLIAEGRTVSSWDEQKQ